MNRKLKTTLIILFSLVLLGFWIQSTASFRLMRAKAYGKKGQEKKAVSLYKRILRRDNIQRDKLWVFGKRLSRSERSLLTGEVLDHCKELTGIEKMRCYEELIGVSPDIESPYGKIYFEYLKDDNFIMASSIAAEYRNQFGKEIPVTSEKNVILFYWKGRFYLDKGLLQPALVEFNRVLKIDPNFTDAYYRIGVIYESIDRSKKAVQYYKKTLELSPDHLGALIRIGSYYKDKGFLNKTADLESRIKELIPEYGLDVNLNKKVGVLGYDFINNDGEFELVFHFQCLDNVESDYRLYLRAIAKDESILSEQRAKYGWLNFNKVVLSRPTSLWQVGVVYKEVVSLDICPYEYRFWIELYKTDRKDRRSCLVKNGTEDCRVYLGFLGPS